MRGVHLKRNKIKAGVVAIAGCYIAIDMWGHIIVNAIIETYVQVHNLEN